MSDHKLTKTPQVGQSELTDGLGLMPCAHCGSTATLQQEIRGGSAGGWFIECGNWRCRMTTPLKYAVMDDVAPLLAEIWNRRSNAVLSGKPRTEL